MGLQVWGKTLAVADISTVHYFGGGPDHKETLFLVFLWNCFMDSLQI